MAILTRSGSISPDKVNESEVDDAVSEEPVHGEETKVRKKCSPMKQY